MKVACILFAGAAIAAAAPPAMAAGTKLSWTPGWDIFNEPLNSATSSVVYALSPSKQLTVTFTLSGATPSKLYQVAMLFFNQCPNVPASFGQFPETVDSGCTPYTRQGVSASTSNTELGVVTTDASGNGAFKVTVGPLASGSYAVEFVARDGSGCTLSGGNGGACNIDFQAPGPVFDDTVTITVP